VIQRFTASARGCDEDGQILLYLILTDEIIESLRTKGIVHAVIGLGFGIERALP
jgi:hypothetical protein